MRGTISPPASPKAPSPARAAGSLARRWLPVCGLAAGLSWGLGAAGINAAMFLGPLLAGLCFSLGGSGLRLPRRATMGSQGVIGCIVARSLDPQVFAFVIGHYLAVAFVLVGTGFATAIVAWGVARWSRLDHETAMWGSMPGAASVMVSFAAELGGDTRLVALMQYLRLVLVIASASLVASLFHHGPAGGAPAAAHSAMPAGLADSVITLGIAMAGVILGQLSRLPAGALFGTVALGVTLHLLAGVSLALPHWIPAVSYGVVGLYVGLQFDSSVIALSLRSLPTLILSTLTLILLSAGIGLLFARMLGVDALTGYMAASPGAIDSVIIISIGSRVNMSVVIAMQAIRFFAVIVLAPALAGLLRRGPAGQARDAGV